MVDVVISYSRADKAITSVLAAALRGQGLSVFYDSDLVPGEQIYDTIRSNIDACSRVFVLWSRSSVSSRWVLSEAGIAASQKKILPLRIDDCNIPIGFDVFHTEFISDFLERGITKVGSWLKNDSNYPRTAVVIDDDDASCEFISSILKNEGFIVKSFVDPSSALKDILLSSPDIVIIDYMMPKIDGIEIIRKLRLSGASYPIIMLTSKSDQDGELLGLVSGADDYIKKPIKTATFLARINARLRDRKISS